MARTRSNTHPPVIRDDDRERIPFRKVELGLWTDVKFLEMSAPQPCGQWLWMNLLTGKRTTPFPGLVVAREAVMADDLGWSIEAFREAFREASDKGMAKADWKAGVVVLQRALLDSSGRPRDTARPVSPNHLRSLAKHWWMIPDCALTREYLQTLEAFAQALGGAYPQAFLDGFAKAIGKPTPKPTPKPCPLQEQEQETGEREEERALPEAPKLPARSSSGDPQPSSNASALQNLISKGDAVAPVVNASLAHPRPAPDPRIKLNHDAWSYAADTHRQLQAEGIDPHAIRWTAMPSGAAQDDLRARTNEILASDPDIQRALEIHRRRVDVAAAEARHAENRHLRWFTPSRIYARESFWKAAEMDPRQVRRAPRSQAGESAPLRVGALGDDS